MTDHRPTDDPTTDQSANNEHPLASPTELAGTTEGAIAAEFAARDAEEALDADAEGAMSGPALDGDEVEGD